MTCAVTQSSTCPHRSSPNTYRTVSTPVPAAESTVSAFDQRSMRRMACAGWCSPDRTTVAITQTAPIGSPILDPDSVNTTTLPHQATVCPEPRTIRIPLTGHSPPTRSGEVLQESRGVHAPGRFGVMAGRRVSGGAGIAGIRPIPARSGIGMNGGIAHADTTRQPICSHRMVEPFQVLSRGVCGWGGCLGGSGW